MPETSTPLPRAEIAHLLPGRMRLRIRTHRDDARFFAEIAGRIAGLAGVRAVRANPRTGSLLIEHEGPAAALLRSVTEDGVLEAMPAEPPPSARQRAYSRRLGAMPPLSVAAVGLAGLGAYQVARGQILGSASENFWMAFRIYLLMGRPRIAALLVAFGVYRLVKGQALGSAESLFYYAAQANRMAKRQDRDA